MAMVEEADKKAAGEDEKEIGRIGEEMAEQELAEERLFRLAGVEREEKAGEELKSELRMLDCPYETDRRSFEHVRSFLTHMGIAESQADLVPLTITAESQSDFQRLVNFLDSDCRLRKSIRIGVIYVKRGQFDQKSILCNAKGSSKYEEFLKELGEEPLDSAKRKADPELLCYYTPAFEVVFHVVTLMPTKEGDEQQLEKKKYVGNDSVHIVWSENDRDYRPGTITGAFNFAHIVVHPLRNGLYRLKIEKKKNKDQRADKKMVDFFGPLITGMMVSMDTLVPLLRYTAVNARKSINYKNLRLFNPISERRSSLGMLIKKFGTKSKFSGDQTSFIDSLALS